MRSVCSKHREGSAVPHAIPGENLVLDVEATDLLHLSRVAIATCKWLKSSSTKGVKSLHQPLSLPLLSSGPAQAQPVMNNPQTKLGFCATAGAERESPRPAQAQPVMNNPQTKLGFCATAGEERESPRPAQAQPVMNNPQTKLGFCATAGAERESPRPARPAHNRPTTHHRLHHRFYPYHCRRSITASITASGSFRHRLVTVTTKTPSTNYGNPAHQYPQQHHSHQISHEEFHAHIIQQHHHNHNHSPTIHHPPQILTVAEGVFNHVLQN